MKRPHCERGRYRSNWVPDSAMTYAPMQQLQEQVDKLEDQIKKERCAHKKIELVHRELELKKVRAGQFVFEGC